MRFLTWNIQSGGGRRVSSILQELERLAPDFMALTEVTCNNLHTLRPVSYTHLTLPTILRV